MFVSGGDFVDEKWLMHNTENKLYLSIPISHKLLPTHTYFKWMDIKPKQSRLPNSIVYIVDMFTNAPVFLVTENILVGLLSQRTPKDFYLIFHFQYFLAGDY